MKQKNYEKYIKELKEQIENNNEQILENDEKTRMAKVNQLEYKIPLTLFFSLLSYCALFAFGGILQNFPISAEFATCGILVTSLSIGTIAHKIFEKKYKLKPRLLAFSNAKTEAQKLEEEIKYKIELEKLKNRNYVLSSTIELIENMKNYFTEKEANNEVECKKKIQELSNELEHAYQKLDIATTQQALHDKTWNVRNKMTNMARILITPLVSAVIFSLITIMTLVAFQNVFVSSSAFASTIVLASPIISGISTYAYMRKRTKDTMKVFHNLNNTLNESALSVNVNEYSEDLNKILETKENLMSQISSIHFQLLVEKSVLESYEASENQTTQTLRPTIHQTFTYEIEEQTEEKGKTFILRRNPINH